MEIVVVELLDALPIAQKHRRFNKSKICIFNKVNKMNNKKFKSILRKFNRN